jgi:hypothetical protein
MINKIGSHVPEVLALAFAFFFAACPAIVSAQGEQSELGVEVLCFVFFLGVGEAYTQQGLFFFWVCGWVTIFYLKCAHAPQRAALSHGRRSVGRAAPPRYKSRRGCDILLRFHRSGGRIGSYSTRYL